MPGESRGYDVKYSVTIDLALPRDRVIRLLEDPAHRPKWLKDLVLHEPERGEEGQVGTESRVVFRSGKSTMECTETITRREPSDLAEVPSARVVRFEREIVAPGMWSAARERLTESGPGNTRWVSENEYRFSGPMRLVSPLLRGVFIRQSRRVMQDFKAFAEHGTDVRETGA